MKTGQSNRNREQNLREAFLAITKDAKFNKWLKIKSSEALGLFEDLEAQVEREMKKVKVEIKDENGKWVKENET